MTKARQTVKRTTKHRAVRSRKTNGKHTRKVRRRR